MTSQTQSNIQGTLLLLLLFCLVSEVAPIRAENNTQLGNQYLLYYSYIPWTLNYNRLFCQDLCYVEILSVFSAVVLSVLWLLSKISIKIEKKTRKLQQKKYASIGQDSMKQFKTDLKGSFKLFLSLLNP
jgi:hypothetical protein